MTNSKEEQDYRAAYKNYVGRILRYGQLSDGCSLKSHLYPILCSCRSCGQFVSGDWRNWVDLPKYPGKEK